ncbi:MAG: FAD-binding oxidoreductase [Alphaproteobacteria bacterium]|jgi:glycine/D-amino acid oxidase-like deaminating enzyme|nr:FAD-binding oxidoreductase [Alphaproteobacteria bacterium]
MSPASADIAIVGGGIVGSSIAYHLGVTGRAGRVVVIEPDPTYEQAASPSGSGGIRQLFSLPENIAMAQYGLGFYRDFETTMAIDGEAAPISFRRQGYLFLSDAGGAAQMEANFRRQSGLGVEAELLSPAEIGARFPSLRTDDVALGVYSHEDAWIDANDGLQGFRRKARSLGVDYLQDRVTAIDVGGGLGLASGQRLAADKVVVAAGAWSAEVASLVGWRLPIEPMSRENHFFRAEDEIEPLSFVKTESDLAFRPEGRGYTGGVPDWSVAPGWNFELSADYFERVVWPALAHRVPAFERLRLERSWRCHYARSRLDLSPIIGAWAGGSERLFVASGFSGHGIMHAPATGRAMAELLLDGSYASIDLARFGYQRVLDNAPYGEEGII